MLTKIIILLFTLAITLNLKVFMFSFSMILKNHNQLLKNSKRNHPINISKLISKKKRKIINTLFLNHKINNQVILV
jgi:hypothetical protein